MAVTTGFRKAYEVHPSQKYEMMNRGPAIMVIGSRRCSEVGNGLGGALGSSSDFFFGR